MGKDTVVLDYFIVAFIDILGFSSMVRYDCERRNGNKYLDRLKSCFSLIKEKQEYGIDIKQFSDSIIISMSLDKNNFISIIDIAREIQIKLLKNFILTRGGISFGKHYTESDFLFSEGLINSYYLEKESAKNPRILLSQELLDLYENKDYLITAQKIIKEDDNKYFINYLNLIQADECKFILEQLYKSKATDYSVIEKYRWLYEYAKSYFGDKLDMKKSRFSCFDDR